MSFVYRWLENIQTSALGPQCLLCAAPATVARELCNDCRQDLPRLTQACRHCAAALSAQARSPVCPACRRQARFERGISAFHYAPPINWLITRLKFHDQLSHARLIGDLLADRLGSEALEPPDALIPVPLHPTGYRRRGFNQAERIATRLAPALERPVYRKALCRRRNTHRQSELPASERAANMRGAFAATRALDGLHVAIVDDVVTTGHTAAAAARALRDAGCRRVDLYCVARA